MAESIVKIKLAVQTDETGKLTAAVDRVENSLKKVEDSQNKASSAINNRLTRLRDLNLEQASVMQTISDKFRELETTRASIESKMTGSFTGDRFGLKLFEAHVNAANKELTNLENHLSNVKSAISNLALAKTGEGFATFAEKERRLGEGLALFTQRQNLIKEYTKLFAEASLLTLPKPTASFATYAEREKAILKDLETYEKLFVEAEKQLFTKNVKEAMEARVKAKEEAYQKEKAIVAREEELSEKRRAYLAREVSAIKPNQPFTFGLIQSTEQLATQYAKQSEKENLERIKAEAATRAFLKRREELEQEFTEKLRQQAESRNQVIKNEVDFAKAQRDRELTQLRNYILDQEAARKSRTVDFGKTITDTGIYKPASDYSNAMVAGMSKSYREIVTAQKEVSVNTNKVVEQHRPWGKSLESLIIQYRAINFAYNQFLNTLYNIPKVGIQLESTIASLTATFGSAVAAQREIQFLNQEALRTGVTVGTLREQYANAAASFIAAGESADTTRRIFQNVNTVATTLHLSSDRVSSVYLALSQIFNKTKLQAEELTKQLSQTIPGVTNQQAKALGITVSELYDKMKKGAISAHEAVLALSETLGQTFGGDAFTAAAQGLNAEVGRLNTSWTLLSENLYKGSEEGLKSTVKFFDSLVRSLVGVTSNTEKTKETFSALTSIISGLLVGSILTGAKAFVDLTVKGEAASTMVGRLVVSIKEFALIMVKNPFILMATALATVASNLYLVKERQDQLNDSVRTHLGLTLAEQKSAGYSVQQTDTFQKNTELLKQTEEEIVRLTKRAETIKNLNSVGNIINESEKRATDEALTNANRNYILLKDYRKKLIADFYKEPESQVTKNIFDASEARAKFEIAADKAAGDKVLSARKQFILSNAKELTEVQRQLDDAIKAGNQEKIDSALKGLQDYQSALSKAGIKDTSAKAATQAYRTDIEETKNSFEQFKTDMADTMGVLNELYAEGQLSIKEYYERRISLMNSDKDIQRQMLEAEKAVASARGDAAKVAKLEGDILKLNTEAAKENSKARVEQTKDLEKYSKALEEIRAAELLSQGIGSEGAVAKFRTQYAGVYKEAIEGQKTEDLALLKRRELTVGLEENLKNLNEEKQLAQQKYNLELDKVNTKVSAGIMGQFQAMSELTKANEDYLKVKEAEYAKMLQFIREVEAGNGTVPAKDRLEAEQMNNEIEKMKLNANEFANYFQKTVGDGFANAFAEFTRGTKTAKEAFTDMAASIVQDLAKMAAQEAASSLMSGILKPLGSSAMSGLGSLGTSFMGLFAANGAAVQGMSSVSGSVLSSATYFPSAKPVAFASGGVVAGEAGAEAVLPLKRNKAGKLGVVLENSGQSDGNVYNISVNVQSSANDTPAGTGEKIAVSIMRTIAREEISSARRSGNFKAARSM